MRKEMRQEATQLIEFPESLKDKFMSSTISETRYTALGSRTEAPQNNYMRAGVRFPAKCVQYMEMQLHDSGSDWIFWGSLSGVGW